MLKKILKHVKKLESWKVKIPILFKWKTSSARWHGFLKPKTKILGAGGFWWPKYPKKMGEQKISKKNKTHSNTYDWDKVFFLFGLPQKIFEFEFWSLAKNARDSRKMHESRQACVSYREALFMRWLKKKIFSPLLLANVGEFYQTKIMGAHLNVTSQKNFWDKLTHRPIFWENLIKYNYGNLDFR